jgi:hypothetical protein
MTDKPIQGVTEEPPALKAHGDKLQWIIGQNDEILRLLNELQFRISGVIEKRGETKR